MPFTEFWERFNALEKKHNLLEMEIGGLPIYALRRVKFFYAVAVALGIYSDPHPAAGSTKDEVQSVALDFSNVAKQPVMVVPFRRLVGGIDPYSQTLVELLERHGKNPKVLDWQWLVGLQRAARAKGRAGLLGKLSRKFSAGSTDAKWNQVVALFEQEFNVKLLGLALPQGFILNFKSDADAAADYFKAAGLAKLYLVDAYSNQWLVQAAHLAGAKVYEIQHGFVNEYHPAYSFPNGSPKLAHVPDELLVWGKFWGEGVKLPDGMTVEVSGASRQFNEYREKLSAIARNEKQIMFTSQGAVSEELQKAAVLAAKALPEFTVIYRLHPNEDLASYPSNGLPENFSYSHKNPIFLELLAQSAYLVGAFSTTLYEGLALGAKVLVLPLAGYENMNRAIASGDVTVISDLGRIGEFIRAAKPAANPDNYYAKELLND